MNICVMKFSSKFAKTLTVLLLPFTVLWGQQPLIAVPEFRNETGGHATRIAPGRYQERIVRTGREQRREDFVEDGRRVQTDSTRDVHDTQVERVVEYLPGDNQLPASAGLIAADELSMALTNSGHFRVFGRSTTSINMRQQERLFAGGGGAVDPNAAVLANLRDQEVTYLVLGRLSRYRIDQTSGVAYGVEINRTTARVTMDLKVIAVDTGEVVWHGAPSEAVHIRMLGDTQTTTMYDWEPVVREAIRKASDRMIREIGERTGAQLPRDQQEITMQVLSDPEGADILVNGIYRGNTPSSVTLPDEQVTMRLELSGYQPWERVLRPSADGRISPRLQPMPEAPPARAD